MPGVGASAGEISRALDELETQATTTYYVCYLKGQIAEKKIRLYGLNSAEAKSSLADSSGCAEQQIAASEKTINAVRAGVKPESKSEALLKEFVTLWRSALKNAPVESRPPTVVIAGIKQKLESVRTEALW
jgi:hypothetical protein